MKNQYVIIFDGVCNFCNNSVNFIIDRDHKNVFKFTPIQSKAAETIMAQYGVKKVGFDTLILVKNKKFYYRSDAALEITKDLSGYWDLFRILVIIPRPIRDYFYSLFAKYRYRIFGKNDTCLIPAPEIKDKFLDD